MSSQDDHTLNLLSEDERLALAELEEDNKAIAVEAAARAARGGDDDDDDDEDDDDADDAAAAPAPAPAPAPATAPVPEDPPAPAPAAEVVETPPPPVPAPAPAPEPAYSFKLPDDFEGRVTALDEKFSTLDKRFDDGEIERAEYQNELRTLTREQSELDGLKQRADISEDMARQANERTAKAEHEAWSAAVVNLCKDALKPELGGLDYENDEKLAKLLIAEATAMTKDADYAGKSKEWIMSEAHRIVAFRKGIVITAESQAKAKEEASKAEADKKAAAKVESDKAAKAEAAAKRKPPIDKVPQTLAHVPGTDGPGDLAGEFVDVDSLEGEAYEEAVSKMTPAQRAKYLAST